MWVWRAVCSFPWHRSMICLRHYPPCARAGTAPWAVALAAHPSLEQWWHQALQGSRVGWDSAHGSGAAAPSFPPSSDQVLLLPGWFQHRGALLPPWCPQSAVEGASMRFPPPGSAGSIDEPSLKGWPSLCARASTRHTERPESLSLGAGSCLSGLPHPSC